jgi:hypothetical protein
MAMVFAGMAAGAPFLHVMQARDAVIPSPGSPSPASAASITVTSPVNGSSYTWGQELDVYWISNGTSGYISIFLYTATGSFVSDFVSWVTDQGGYAYIVPDAGILSGYYKFLVEDSKNPSVCGFSGTFYITAAPGNITVTDPTPSCNWTTGGTYIITWTSFGTTGDVNISLEDEFGNYISTIADAYCNGECYWEVPASGLSSGYYRIFIQDIPCSNINASSSLFYIFAAPPTIITVTNPTSSSIWMMGNSYHIQWVSSNSCGYLVIDLTDTFHDYITSIAVNASDTGDYYWTVPTSGLPAGTYEIHINDASRDSFYAFSSPFLISQNLYLGAALHLSAIQGNAQITLAWQEPQDTGGSPIAGYRIYMGTSPDTETLVTVVVNETTYTFTGLANGRTLYFTLSAVDGNGTVLISAEISATPAGASTGLENPLVASIIIIAILASIGIASFVAYRHVKGNGAKTLANSGVPEQEGSDEQDAFDIETSKAHAFERAQGTGVFTSSTLVIPGGRTLQDLRDSISDFRKSDTVLHVTTQEPLGKADSKPAASVSRPGIFLLERASAAPGQAAARCVVHKGSVRGARVTCNACGAVYCQECFKELLMTTGHCWQCGAPLEQP